MKNHECLIRFVTAAGWTQTVRKRGPGGPWIQTTNGVERTMTAEQLLSHLLPALTTTNLSSARPRVRVDVVPDMPPDAPPAAGQGERRSTRQPASSDSRT